MQDLQPRIEDVTIGHSVLQGMRRNERLSLCDPTVFEARKCGHPIGLPDPCLADAPAVEKCNGPGRTIETFKKFSFYSADYAECLDPDTDPAESAREVVLAGTGYAIAQELENGKLTGNKSLQSEATDRTGDNALPPARVIDEGLRMLGAQGFGRGSIVVPFGALGTMAQQNQIISIGGVYRSVGNLPVITGPGITGTAPDGSYDPLEPYVYFIPGAVEYNFSDPRSFFDDDESSKSVLLNRKHGEVSRIAKIRFNPHCIIALRMCLASCSGCEA